MTIDDKIKHEKLQYHIIREAAKKISEYTCKEILTSDPSRIIEQAKFTYSPLGKTLEKQTKMIEEQGEK